MRTLSIALFTLALSLGWNASASACEWEDGTCVSGSGGGGGSTVAAVEATSGCTVSPGARDAGFAMAVGGAALILLARRRRAAR